VGYSGLGKVPTVVSKTLRKYAEVCGPRGGLLKARDATLSIEAQATGGRGDKLPE
jgi:hypothetical protein